MINLSHYRKHLLFALFANEKTAPRRAGQKNLMNLVLGVRHLRGDTTEPDSKKFLRAFFKKHCFSLAFRFNLTSSC
jgi:hypothetical protein